MGSFFKAFWGEMGRNTAKRVSNSIFGDKWSTPYRRVSSNSVGMRRRSNSVPSVSGGTSRSRGWVSWVIVVVLISGTYNVIINPNLDDILFVLLLWIVAIVYFIVRILLS